MYSCSSDHLCILLYICLSSTWKIESLQWSHKWLAAINSNYVFFNFHSKWWFSRMTNDFFFFVNCTQITFLTYEQAFCIRLSVLMALGIYERCSGDLLLRKKNPKTNLRCILSHIVLQQRFQFCISPHRHFCP